MVAAAATAAAAPGRFIEFILTFDDCPSNANADNSPLDIIVLVFMVSAEADVMADDVEW